MVNQTFKGIIGFDIISNFPCIYTSCMARAKILFLFYDKGKFQGAIPLAL